MLSITSIFSAERSHAQIEGVSKKRVLEILAQSFADSVEDLEVNDVYQHFISREKLGTTGIGGGIAIPHCRLNTGGDTFGACITLEKAIDFDAVDGKPVDVLVAMLVPENAEEAHLKLLAQLAERLQTETFIRQIRRADSDGALFDLMATSD